VTTADHVHWLKAAGGCCEYASAIFGILGTALMARRCSPQVVRGLLYAASWPVLLVLGQGRRARAFFVAKASINWDTADSPADMTLGLNLLFWAFFLQLLALFLK